MNKFTRSCQCFSLRRATSLLQLLIVIVILGLLAIVLTVNRILMDSMISEIADMLLFKQNFQQNEIQTNLFQHQVSLPLIRGFQLLSELNYIYHDFLPNLNINNFQNPLICPLFNGKPHQESNNTFLKLSEFCIYYQDEINAKNKNYYYLYLNFLNTLLMPLIMDAQDIYLTNVDDNFLFASCPPIFNYPNYNPHLRPWFTNHIQQAKDSNNDAFVSNIYQSFGSELYSFTLTQSLISHNIDAVIGYDLSFSVYSNLLQQKQFVYFIVNPLGQIISTNQEQQLNISLKNQAVEIFQQNITGFNETDWIEIQNSVLKLSFINSCSFDLHHLCRYNSKFKLDIILHVLNIQSDFYLIIFQNITLQQENIAKAEASKLQVIKAFSHVLLYLIFTSAFLLICTWIGMYLFFRPFKKMQQLLNTQIRCKFASPDWQQQCYKACDDKRNSFLNQALKILRTKISDINNKKCLNCHLVENFRYPRKQLFLEFFQMKELLKNLKESSLNNLLFKLGNQTILTGYIHDTFEYQANQNHEIIPSPVMKNVNAQTIQTSIVSETDENVKLIGKTDTFRYFAY